SYDRSYVFPLFTRGQGYLVSHEAVCLDRALVGRYWASLLPGSKDGLVSRDLALDVLTYTLAVLNAPSYSRRFGQRIKRDWPKVPPPGTSDLFQSLSRVGAELLAIQ